MAKKKKVWSNKKVPGKFAGFFIRDKDGERNFQLKRDVTKGGKARRITFESPEAAKALGWKGI